jgi:hypothetical protein
MTKAQSKDTEIENNAFVLILIFPFNVVPAKPLIKFKADLL